MLLLVVDLLLGLCQVRLELVVCVGALRDPLLEGGVGVGPGGPHVVGALGDEVVDVSTETLRGGAGTLGLLDVVGGVLGPSVGDADVGVHLLDAAVDVDGAGGVLDLLAMVV